MLPGLLFLARIIKHVAGRWMTPSSYKSSDQLLPLGWGGGSEGCRAQVSQQLIALMPRGPETCSTPTPSCVPGPGLAAVTGDPEKRSPKVKPMLRVPVKNQGQEMPQGSF